MRRSLRTSPRLALALAKGDTAAAIAAFRRAVDIGTRTKHPVTADSQAKLRQLEKATTQAGKAKP